MTSRLIIAYILFPDYHNNSACIFVIFRMLLVDMPSHIETELGELVHIMWGLQGRNVEESVGQILTSELTMDDSPWSLSQVLTASGKEGKGKEGVKLRQLLMEMIRVMRR